MITGTNHKIGAVCGEGFDPPHMTDSDGARTSGQNRDFCLTQGEARGDHGAIVP